eukprot:GFUD01062249.1.p1 GENE.GFUD01062249.1~~GFUD01062249.1.p1  ORF type:complete len:270 (-),score=95.38 GFUD01062249.1:17-826(-)
MGMLFFLWDILKLDHLVNILKTVNKKMISLIIKDSNENENLYQVFCNLDVIELKEEEGCTHVFNDDFEEEEDTYEILVSEDYFEENEEDYLKDEDDFEMLISEDYFEEEEEDNQYDNNCDTISDDYLESDEDEDEDNEDVHINMDNCQYYRNNRTGKLEDDISTSEESGLESFWESISRFDTEMFSQYLDVVVDINARDADDANQTALHKAAITGNIDILNTLLSYGGDISAVSGDGVTPLYLAEVRGHADVVGRILERGQYDLYSLVK